MTKKKLLANLAKQAEEICLEALDQPVKISAEDVSSIGEMSWSEAEKSLLNAEVVGPAPNKKDLVELWCAQTTYAAVYFVVDKSKVVRATGFEFSE